MSEILIHYDYNGGYFVRHHYSPLSPWGVGRSVDEAMRDFLKKDRSAWFDFRHYRLCLMDEVAKENNGGEITPDQIRAWQEFYYSLSEKDFIKAEKCECCGMMPYTPFPPSHFVSESATQTDTTQG